MVWLCACARWDETQHAPVVEAKMSSFDVWVALAQDTVIGHDHPLAVVPLGPPTARADFSGCWIAVARGLAGLRFLAVTTGRIGAWLLPLGIVLGVMEVMAVVLRPGLRCCGKGDDEHR